MKIDTHPIHFRFKLWFITLHSICLFYAHPIHDQQKMRQKTLRIDG